MPDNMPFIVAAFGITWVVLLSYAWHLHRVRAEAQRRLREANEALTGGGRA